MDEAGYSCVKTSRNNTNKSLEIDLESEESIQEFCKKNDLLFDAILFFQGVNPSKNTKETSAAHFNRMLAVNLSGPALLMKQIHSQLNENAMMLFLSSVASRKGSYDPAYAAAKAGLEGLMQSFANEFKQYRFNIISLGLVEGSPVFNQMTPDFRARHFERMNNQFVQPRNVASMILELLSNSSINRAHISLDAGFTS